MKKIYQIVFLFSVLFFITGHKNVSLAQTDNNNKEQKSFRDNPRFCHSFVNENALPLYIVDGVPQSETDSLVLTRINPNDIEAITALESAIETVLSDTSLHSLIVIKLKNDEPKEKTKQTSVEKEVLIDVFPKDIESITLLKGIVATTLYGSRAIKGVILIKLKKEEKIVVEEKIKKEKEISINVFPNPTSESVTITLNLKQQSVVQIKMYNLQTLESYEISKEEYEAGEQKITWKVDSLQNGTYNIKIKIGNQIIDRKLVIQK